MTTNRGVCLTFLLLLLIGGFNSLSAETSNNSFPFFRYVDSGAVVPAALPKEPIKFLTDSNFPPFSFQKTDAAMAGISIELAQAACAELKISCLFVAKPFSELLPALKNHEGDAIISGLRLTPEILKQVLATRPYFFSTARFIARIGMPFSEPDVKSLAGRRIGFIKATSHAAFLEKYFERSALVAFDDESALFEALRTGTIDAAFGDSMHMAFWLKGSNARGCCQELGKSFIDRSTFSRNLSLLVNSNQADLREALDFALDRLEEKGVSAKIFAHYLPSSPF